MSRLEKLGLKLYERARASIVEGKSGAWMHSVAPRTWLYELDETQIPLDLIDRMARNHYFFELILSAMIRRPAKLFISDSSPEPPGKCVTITCFGPKPRFTPDQMVDIVKKSGEKFRKLPIWE